MEQNAAPRQALAAQCDALHKAFQAELNAREEALAKKYEAQIAERLQGLKKERAYQAAKLKELGFFQFSKKRQLQEELERLEKCIEDYSGPAHLQQARMENLRRIDKAAALYRAKLDDYMARRFPYEAMRAQAELEFKNWYRGSQSQVKDTIYDALQKKPGMTREEISTAHPVIQERSQRRIDFLLGEMEEGGEIAVKENGQQPRYYTAGHREPKRPNYPQLDFAYEDPAVAAQPIPQPPKAEEVL